MPNFSNETGQGTSDLQRIMANLTRMRFFRRQYDQKRAFFYRQYLGQRDPKNFPDNTTPRSNTFVPYPLSNVETVVARTIDAFFSIDPPIEVRGRGAADQIASDPMQKVMLYGLHRAKWINQFETLVRNIAIYGHAGWKVDWDWEYDTINGPEPIFAQAPVMDPVTQQPKLDTNGQPFLMNITGPDGMPIQLGVRQVTQRVPRNCPKLIPIDVFDLLVDPDGGQIAHLFEKTLAQLMRESESNPNLYDPAAVAELVQKVTNAHPDDPAGTLIRMAELWDESDNSISVVTFGEDREAISWKDLRYSFRTANYSSYKRQVYVGSPILLYRGQNPFAHKRAPILHTSYTKLPNEVFGMGIIEKISDVAEGLNKFVNMITDNWNLGINHRYVYDTQVDIDHDALQMFNVPGGKVGVTGNPNEAIFPLPSFTPGAGDYQILDVYRGMIELASGVSDFYSKGIGTPRGNRTSSGIQQVMSEGNYLFRMFIRNLEVDILQPTMEMVASMIQQFGSDQMEYQLTDAPPGIPKWGHVPLASLIGNFEFDFVAANYATDKIIRQRNMMAFYNIASQTPYANQGEFIREIGKVMEIPNTARLVKPDQQVQMEQAMNQKNQLELMLVEKLLDAESKSIVTELGRKPGEQGGIDSATQHALQVQEFIEDFLQNYAGIPVERTTPPQPGGQGEGRPATRQFEGKIPGAGHTGVARSMGQEMGANGMGLGGILER